MPSFTEGGTIMEISIGSKIVGLPNNGYGTTNSDCLLEVTDISPNGGMLDATIIAHKNPSLKKKIGEEVQNLRIASFRLATESEVNEFLAKPADPKAKALETYKLKSDLVIKVYDGGKVESSFNTARELRSEFDPERITALNNLVGEIKDLSKKDVAAFKILSYAKKHDDFKCFNDIFSEEAMAKAVENFIKFFVEFQFEPNFRFMNTLAWKSQNSIQEAKEYISRYFKLTTSPYVTNVEDKIKSPEFAGIMNYISLAEPSTVVNSRFKVYYGSQGTGKTTKAMQETDNRCVVCNNSMLPQDLMEDFEFDDGKPGFSQSILRECMTEGKGLTLDEINLLPFETIRFLQGILDGKKEFTWKGDTVTIADGFNIIGTMNLMVNGMSFGLPEPLVDRCSDIQESKLTAKDLLSTLG